MPVTVMFACNDWRNGNDLGYFGSAELFGCELSGPRVKLAWKREKLSSSNAAEGDEMLRVGRLVLPCLGYRGWVGNWCWDAARVRPAHAVAIWNYLAAKPDWRCEAGPCELGELFDKHGQIEPRHAPEFLARILNPELAAVVQEEMRR